LISDLRFQIEKLQTAAVQSEIKNLKSEIKNDFGLWGLDLAES